MIENGRKKILLGHLNSNGDCLFATVIARQIKEVDYPNCHLTWAVNRQSKQAVFLNPYVDEIWEIPTEKSTATEEEWNNFTSAAKNRKRSGEFDFVFFTQIIGDNRLNYDGGIRSSIYNNYPHEITVSHQPTIRLSDAEVENVKLFAERYNLQKYKHIILVECGPDSFKSPLNIETASRMAFEIAEMRNDTAFILSSNKQISSASVNVIDGSSLTFRENAELTKYCSLMIGCGSGISWLTTTNWAKNLDKILIVDYNAGIIPSMIYDHEYIKLPTNNIIEIRGDEDSMKKVKAYLTNILDNGFSSARQSANSKIHLSNFLFISGQIKKAIRESGLSEAFLILKRYVKRNGLRIIFRKDFMKALVHLAAGLFGKPLRDSD